MFVCHKYVVSKAVAVLQVSHTWKFKVSIYVHATLAVSIMPVSWEVMCRWASSPVSSITSGFSNTITRQQRITTSGVARCSCHTHENYMHAKQIIVFYIFFTFFAVCIWYCFQLYYTEQLLLFIVTLFFVIIIYDKCIK